MYKVSRGTIYNQLLGKHGNSCGRPTAFSKTEEKAFVQHLLLLAEFDMPIIQSDVRACIKYYLEERGQTIPTFKNNLPGRDWLCGFLARHKILSVCVATNIKLVRAAVSEEILQMYNGNLKKTSKVFLSPTFIILTRRILQTTRVANE